MLGKAPLVNLARQENTFTANGAVTHSTSLHNVVDMFFLAGASRNMSETDILKLWTGAIVEDKELAFKCLFRARDIRGGAGERRFFRIIWNSLSLEDIRHYQNFVSTYGRRDDLHETSLDYLVEQFKNPDPQSIGLLAKWTPRKGKVFEYIRKALRLTPKEFRRILVHHTNIVENLMSFNQWEGIDYGKIPSQAMQKYKKAFYRHDGDRFQNFIETKPESIKAGTLFPYQLYQSYKRGEKQDIINTQWNNLPNYVGEGKSFLPMIDVSGSMTSSYGDASLTPMDISVSLGVYLSEKNKSIFENAFITFTSSPTMQYLKGTACQRFQQIQGPVGYDTNLQAAFKLVLDTATRNNLNQSDMPDSIIVISDMEFNDSNVGGLSVTNHKALQKQYEVAGYKMPNLVYWNVNGRTGNSPVAYDTTGTALVSGASPAIMKSLLGGEDMTPIGIMLKTLNSDRYKDIV